MNQSINQAHPVLCTSSGRAKVFKLLCMRYGLPFVSYIGRHARVVEELERAPGTELGGNRGHDEPGENLGDGF